MVPDLDHDQVSNLYKTQKKGDGSAGNMVHQSIDTFVCGSIAACRIRRLGRQVTVSRYPGL